MSRGTEADDVVSSVRCPRHDTQLRLSVAGRVMHACDVVLRNRVRVVGSERVRVLAPSVVRLRVGEAGSKEAGRLELGSIVAAFGSWLPGGNRADRQTEQQDRRAGRGKNPSSHD
jgi:hypothetical protein